MLSQQLYKYASAIALAINVKHHLNYYKITLIKPYEFFFNKQIVCK